MDQIMSAIRANPSTALAVGFVFVALVLWVFERALHRG